MELAAKVEAVLFYRAEPLSTGDLEKILRVSSADIAAAIVQLKTSLAGRGISLLESGGNYEMRTAPEAASIIESLRKEELERDLSKASLETLTIILYRGPIARADIDFIRGVNSTFILRSLMIRGLIERLPDPADERKLLYRPTHDLLAHLGIRSIEELPEYRAIHSELLAYESAAATEGSQN